MQARVRKAFLGGNTGYGFHSFYEQVVSGAETRTYILKGGSGTGKSTFMRFIANQMTSRGYAVDEYYCSSDSNSLDGVRLPDLGVTLIDGTAPHMIDPRHPGAIESAIDLSVYWDEAAIRTKREHIKTTTREKSFLFRRAYGYLALAKQANDEQESYISGLGALNTVGLNRVIISLIEQLLPVPAAATSTVRQQHLFATAITPQGIINHLPSIIEGVGTRVLVRGPLGTGRTTIINAITQAATQKGYDTVLYHCALDPRRIDHVVIPQLGIAVCNVSEPHGIATIVADEIIDTSVHLDSFKLKPFAGELESLQKIYQDTLTAAIRLLKQAKSKHEYLESLYIPHMDFTRLGVRRQQVLQEILELAELR